MDQEEKAEVIEKFDDEIISHSLVDVTKDIILSAEKSIIEFNKILAICVKRTNQTDWVNQQGKPYLTCSGAEKIAGMFGIGWEVIKREKITSEDDRGSFYYYEYTMKFNMGKNSIQAIGTCSSRDQFFAKRKDEWKPLSEIDETNINKSAYSNCVVNGITRILGLRNLNWETLKSMGIDQDKMPQITYGKEDIISEAQQKRLFAICKESNVKHEDLKQYLLEKYKIESSNLIKKKDYESICNWVGEKK